MNKLITVLLIASLPIFSLAKNKNAFLVGISGYSKLGNTDWNNIHGAQDIYLIKPILEKQGFSVTSLLDAQATYDGIINGLKAFIKKLHYGDIVYLHFSTHGQPVEDGLNGMGLDESDGWDEAIVPIDARKEYSHEKQGYKGDKHITDDQLSIYLNDIRKKIGKTGMLYVIMDACHAGELSRGGLETIRGTNIGLSRSGKVYSYGNADKETKYTIKREKGYSDIIVLEACTSREKNTEIKINGKEYGSLSYNVYRSLLMAPLDKNPQTFENNVKTSINTPNRWPNAKRQHLVVEKSY